MNLETARDKSIPFSVFLIKTEQESVHFFHTTFSIPPIEVKGIGLKFHN